MKTNKPPFAPQRSDRDSPKHLISVSPRTASGLCMFSRRRNLPLFTLSEVAIQLGTVQLEKCYTADDRMSFQEGGGI